MALLLLSGTPSFTVFGRVFTSTIFCARQLLWVMVQKRVSVIHYMYDRLRTPPKKNIDLVLQLARTPSSLDIYSKKCFGSESLTEMPGWLRQPLKCFLFCVTFVFTDNLIFKFISLSINNFVFGTVCLKWHCTTEHQPSSSA